MNIETSGTNIAILSSAADLVKCLVKAVAGDEISATTSGKPLEDDTIDELTLMVFSSEIGKLIRSPIGLNKGV